MVEILKSGLYDTIQDLGRPSYQQFGVPLSGVMDVYSASLANALVSNGNDAAVVECMMTGPKLKFHNDALICITGAKMQAKLNDVFIANNTAIIIKSGDILSFGRLELGCRTYIAIAGGFRSELIMGSRSMYQDLTNDHKLKTGDRIPVSEEKIAIPSSFASVKTKNNYFKTKQIQVIKGPEFESLSLEQQRSLFENEFTISSDSNRMAYQFDERFENQLQSMITSLVLPGTVQLTPNGQLFVLMKDCQTTGGYPRVLQVIESSIGKLSQKLSGDKIQFKCIAL
ncbi:MAG: biotin-dependent carboxyltransferase family protein [Psychroserpens sp.]|uniref:5-oxoprolinase subunit C family protein n=1 Tax=Psychroserpens sp. TaxID=2020870 RepID=UPI003C7F7BE7